MRIKDAFTTVIGLVLSLSVLTGLAYTEQFQQAARFEVGGFDALAHDLFSSTQLASGEGPDSPAGVDDGAVSKQ